jgi:predicted dehydrogenase
MKPVEAALIGAGGRGIHTFGGYALGNPRDLRFVAVAEPDDERRVRFAAQHQIPAERQYRTWEELLARPQMCEGLVIATMDRLHYAPTIHALDAGYDILLEKPMSPDARECIGMAERAAATGRLLMICHGLRYVPFFATLKRLIDEGQIGRVVSVQHNENVGYFHQAHSFVRGNWRNLEVAAPMILAKCCHDMDMLAWLVGTHCQRVSSFGALTWFRPENAPQGSTARCTDGCAVERQCPFSARRIYQEEHPDWGTFIALDNTPENVQRALEEGPYGRCVYRCDNDVVDHQVVTLEFDGDVTVAFTMCAFTHEIARTIKIMGTDGEIRGHAEQRRIEVRRFSTREVTVIETPESSGGHGGGDWGLMRTFTRLVRAADTGERARALTSAAVSVESHLIALAAEQSRLEKRVIEMADYVAGIQGNG